MEIGKKYQIFQINTTKVVIPFSNGLDYPMSTIANNYYKKLNTVYKSRQKLNKLTKINF